MDKFNRTLHGYDPDEVNAFLDQVINHVEKMVNEMKEKDAKIKDLESKLTVNEDMRAKLETYEKLEESLKQTAFMAERTGEQIKNNAYRESEMILEDAKKNANRIVNNALLKAERASDEAALLKRNVNIFKRRLRSVIEEQLEMVNEIEKIDF